MMASGAASGRRRRSSCTSLSNFERVLDRFDSGWRTFYRRGRRTRLVAHQSQFANPVVGSVLLTVSCGLKRCHKGIAFHANEIARVGANIEIVRKA